MSKFEQYCECSKPDSGRKCRVYCGMPRYPFDKRDVVTQYMELTGITDRASAYRELYLGKFMPLEDNDND